MTFLVVAINGASAQAFSLSDETLYLNQTFNQSLGYPILVVDRNDFKIDRRLSEDQVVQDLMIFSRQKFSYSMAFDEARTLVPYFTASKGRAAAMPFFNKGPGKKKLKYCVVMSGGSSANLEDEIKRILGSEGQKDDLSGKADLARLSKLVSLKDLQLFSLYHELSHCLDQNYLAGLYQTEVDPHDIHLAESFAEATALLLLAKHRGLNKLGTLRGELRARYTKSQGPILANSSSAHLEHPVAKAGGSIYFLTEVILATQSEIEKKGTKIQKESLQDILKMANFLVEQHALSPRGFQALHRLLGEGEKVALPYYKKLSEQSPELFLKAYEELLRVQKVLNSTGF